MCLISALPKGTVKYNKTVESFITKGFTTQRDGSGVMWKKNGENVVNIKKGFFNLPKLLEFVEGLELTVDDELVIHHRTSTQGLVSRANTHPFVLSDNHEICISEEGSFKLPILVHNGMFRGMSKFDHNDFSDTYSFCNGFLSNKHLLGFFKEDTKKFLDSFDAVLGWSKLAVLFPDMDMIMTGDFTEDSGYFHSNQCYKDYNYMDRGGRTYSIGRSQQDISYSNTKKKNRTGKNNTTGTDISKETSIINPSLLNSVLGSFSWDQGTKNYLSHKRFDDSNIKLTPLNCNHFIYLLKDGITVGNIDNVKAYKLTSFCEDIDSCCLFLPTLPNYLIQIKLSSLRNCFYYIPTTQHAYMYNDFLYLEEKLVPSKTQLKKIEKQILSKYNKEDGERFIIKKLGELCSRGGAKLWLEKHKNNPFKAVLFDSSGKLLTSVKESLGIDKQNRVIKSQEDREMTFSD